MGYESINKLKNDEIQQLAEAIIESLNTNSENLKKNKEHLLIKLIKLIKPKLRYQIWKYVKNNDDLEDILSDCILKIYSKIETYNIKYRFTTWVYTITYNEVVSFLKAKKKRKEIPLQFSSMSDRNSYIEENEKLVFPELVDFDIDGVVDNEIFLLPDGLNKNIIIDTQYNRLKIRELAVKYDISENTIKTKQRITREKIKNSIYKKYPILKNNISKVL